MQPFEFLTYIYQLKIKSRYLILSNALIVNYNKGINEKPYWRQKPLSCNAIN